MLTVSRTGMLLGVATLLGGMVFGARAFSSEYNYSGILNAPNSVAYRIATPKDYDGSSPRHVIISLGGGTTRLDYRLASLGDMDQTAVSHGWKPILVAIDFGSGNSQGTWPPAGDAVYTGFKGVIDYILSEYNTYPYVFATGFCAGGSFLSHYHVYMPQETRLVGITPWGSPGIRVPTVDEVNHTARFRFMSGTTDGNFMAGYQGSVAYDSLGYESSFYASEGTGHSVSGDMKEESALFFLGIIDEMERSGTRPPAALTVHRNDSRRQLCTGQVILDLRGRVLTTRLRNGAGVVPVMQVGVEDVDHALRLVR